MPSQGAETNRLDPNPDRLAYQEDWEGNTAAFTCPQCEKVFIVTEELHNGTRSCPNCGEATGHVSGDRRGGGVAWLEWP